MIGGLAKSNIPVTIPDPAADSTVVVYRAPKGQGRVTITGASIASVGAQAGGASNGRSFKLRKRGVDGKATAVDITNALGAVSGGNSPAWEAGAPKDFTVVGADDFASTVNVLEPGEVLDLVYDETGTDAPGLTTLFVEVALGVA